MTGIYVPVLRDGVVTSVEIERLTKTDFELLALDRPEAGWFYARQLCWWIRENARIEVPRAEDAP